MDQADIKTKLVQAWEEWDDETDQKPAAGDSPKLCKIENPDCESCQ